MNIEYDVVSLLLKRVVGKEVTYSRSGGGAGSVWLIKFQGECSVMISCTWRIEYGNIVLATSNDDTTAVTGRIARSVRQLEEKHAKLLSIELSRQKDLVMLFEGGYCARVFFDIFRYSEGWCHWKMENWNFAIPSLNLCIVANSRDYFRLGKYYEYDGE